MEIFCCRNRMSKSPLLSDWIGPIKNMSSPCRRPIGNNSSDPHLDHTPEALQNWIQSVAYPFRGKARRHCRRADPRSADLCARCTSIFCTSIPSTLRRWLSYGRRFIPAGPKMIPWMRICLLEILMKHRQHLRVWVPDDVLTRSIRLLTEGRRHLVDERTALTNQLTAALKTYFPQALDWFGDLAHLSCVRLSFNAGQASQHLKRATPSSIRKFYKLKVSRRR